MSLMPPGSTPWLLGHEIRLAWRGRSQRRGLVLSMIALFFVLPALGGGVAIGLALRNMTVEPTPLIDMIVVGAAAVIWTLMLSQTLGATTQAFYERGDLDLLLSSPLPPRRVLTVRCLAIATMPFVAFAGVLTPFLVPVAVLGHWPWLAAYGVLAALALSATAAGLLVGIVLFALIGPRRTRAVAQLLAALVGAAFFILGQIHNIFPKAQAQGVWQRMAGLADKGWFDAGTFGAWPARAAMGEATPTLVLVGGAFLLFAVVVSGLGNRFAANAAAAIGADKRRTRPDRSKVRGFRGGAFRAMVDKDRRLLLRDPALLAQVFLRVLYLLPAALVLWRSAGRHADVAVAAGAGTVSFLAGQMAANLAWITVSAEDAPDLLDSSPATRATLRRAKLVAALTPVALILLVPVAGLAWFSPWAGLCSAVGCFASAASSGLIEIWWQKPGRRQDFRRRRGGSLVATLGGTAAGFAWAGATGLAVAGNTWAIGPALLAVAIVAMLRKPDPGVGS